MGQPFFFNIDVLGSCNLRCPSCPQGNSRDVPVPTGFMPPDLLRKIMKKATDECTVSGVGLFNWTEPLLHPRLPELVEIVQSYGVPCTLSSNLNFMRNIDAVLASNPSSLRISTSGFTQSVYEFTHRGGDIEVVKAHMRELAEAKRRVGSRTKIHVLYHRYLGNLDDEVLMKAYSESLGFGFEPVWAMMMPLGKVLAAIEGQEGGEKRHQGSDGKKRLRIVSEAPAAETLSTEDVQVLDRLALPLDEALSAARRHSSDPCGLRDNQMTIDFEGNTFLCCAAYDPAKYTLGPFLDIPHTELQASKYSHDGCTKCMDNGVHVYFTYGAPEFERLARARIARRYADVGLNFEETAVQRGVRLVGLSLKARTRGMRTQLRRYEPFRKYEEKVRSMVGK